MSVKIAGGVTGALQEVGSTSKGAYVELVDTAGNPLSHSGANYGGWEYENGAVTFEENSVEANYIVDGIVVVNENDEEIVDDAIIVDGFKYRVDGDTATFFGMA